MAKQLMFDTIDANYLATGAHIGALVEMAQLSPKDRKLICEQAAQFVRDIRNSADPGLMEVFLAEYGLSTDEGIALMCLAEAFLRVPDAETLDALIEDKIVPSNWGEHLGRSSSSLVNASTWALMLTGRVLDDEHSGMGGALRGAVKRLGEPVIRVAVARAMREMGRQFVLGETIDGALGRAAGMERKGFTYSYDMLGEAARTKADADGFFHAYQTAIKGIAKGCKGQDVTKNPGISIKLSALHPRYEVAQEDRILAELAPRLRALALQAKSANMGLNVDAEEADRLVLSLKVIETVLSDPALEGWDGFGLVVQAYGPRCPFVIDWVYDLTNRLNRRVMLRLVKGAYWDAEIKRAQVLGLPEFPVFTAKAETDVSYLANARKLLSMTDRIYPQFATHNAHTVAAILHMADGVPNQAFEFQRLHGMGETLHTMVLQDQGTRCRIYAPVGAHEDLLAYLVRRLLENGANSSFVNQIVDEDVPPEQVASDPFLTLSAKPNIATGPQVFQPIRGNSKGWDITDYPTLRVIEQGRAEFARTQWQAGPLLGSSSGQAVGSVEKPITNPANPADQVGTVQQATAADVATAFETAQIWDASAQDRAAVLAKAADLYEAQADELFATLHREAGKTLLDCVGELREAVDFLHYYGAEAARTNPSPRGTWACISPWNFPLAIFTGQIAAALAAGNAVLAKPAEQTPLIAYRAVELLHQAGVPRHALQLLPGDGQVGARLTSDPRLAGVAFTGSTPTALKIRATLAEHAKPGTPFIAETGGINAMVVDSTALPEHAVRDIIASAFQSAGQRCSALRCLYVQEDIADSVIAMLAGAMDELCVGDPWQISTDVGPVIDETARAKIMEHIAIARKEGRVLHVLRAPDAGTFVAPTMIRVDGIKDLKEEVFGPVLHVASFAQSDLPDVLTQINQSGYGLTFGLHSRIDDRVQHIVETVDAGNIYINRNQIGAVVASQPFGGEGLSGTGPKAGGPNYLPRFAEPHGGGDTDISEWASQQDVSVLQVQVDKALPSVELPVTDMLGPTGESNRLHMHPKGPVLCLGPGAAASMAQADAVESLGGMAVMANGAVDPDALKTLAPIGGVIWWGDEEQARAFEKALAQRSGPIVPLITSLPDAAHVCHERHVCIDTTAAGGNAALLAEVSSGQTDSTIG